MLTIFGRRGFWPRRATVAYDPEGRTETREGIWRRTGDKVLRAPLAAFAFTSLVFLVGALGLLGYKVDY